MSFISDGLSSYIAGLGNVYKGAIHGVTGGMGFARNVEDFIQREMIDKSSLRGAQTESVLAGTPIVGDLLRGVEGVQTIEDLYNNTGKTAAYPANQNLGASGIGYGATAAAKVASGKSDLYEYYAGEPDDFRSMQNGMYGW